MSNLFSRSVLVIASALITLALLPAGAHAQRMRPGMSMPTMPPNMGMMMPQFPGFSPFARNPYAGFASLGRAGLNPYSRYTPNPYGSMTNPYTSMTSGYGGAGYGLGYGGSGYGGSGQGYGNGSAKDGTTSSGYAAASYTAPRQAGTAGGIDVFGLPHETDTLSWPLGLRILAPAAKSQELRQEVDAQVQLAAAQAATGQVRSGTVEAATNATSQLRDLLRKKGGSAGMAEQTVRDAEHFLDRIDRVLRSAMQ